MKTHWIKILTLLALSTVACSPEPKRADGTVDSGGGNGYNQKMLESFRKDLTETDAYSQKIEPILKNVSLRSAEVASTLYSVLLLKPWYLVPFDLKELDPSTIGVQFNSDQLALHYLGEIWISNKYWTGMNLEQQTQLIIHEIIMGARLYKFKTDREKCVTRQLEIGEKIDSFSYKSKTKKCEIYRFSDVKKEYSEKFLTKEEYQTIRYLTSQIVLKNGELSEIDGEKLSSFVREQLENPDDSDPTSSSEIEVEPL